MGIATIQPHEPRNIRFTSQDSDSLPQSQPFLGMPEAAPTNATISGLKPSDPGYAVPPALLDITKDEKLAPVLRATPGILTDERKNALLQAAVLTILFDLALHVEDTPEGETEEQVEHAIAKAHRLDINSLSMFTSALLSTVQDVEMLVQEVKAKFMECRRLYLQMSSLLELCSIE
jgi:hypothetical protein